VPSARSVVAGGQIYGVGDLPVNFNEAAAATVDDIILNPH
jgi:hypothetical protein